MSPISNDMFVIFLKVWGRSGSLEHRKSYWQWANYSKTFEDSETGFENKKLKKHKRKRKYEFSLSRG